MSKTFQQRGDQIEIIAATGGVAMNDIVGLTDINGVSLSAVAAGKTAVIALEGVFNGLTKTAGATQALSIGQKVFATPAGAVTVTVSGPNKALGWAVEAAATGATVATIKLGGF